MHTLRVWRLSRTQNDLDMVTRPRLPNEKVQLIPRPLGLWARILLGNCEVPYMLNYNAVVPQTNLHIIKTYADSQWSLHVYQNDRIYQIYISIRMRHILINES